MKILFVSSSRKGKGISPFIESQKQSLIEKKIYVDTFLIPGSGFLNYFKSAFLIRRQLLKSEYDIIHAHYNLTAMACIYASISLKIKLVTSFMGDDLQGTYNKKNKLTLKGRINILLSKLLIPFYSGIIVKSKRMYIMINSKYTHKISVIPNGVNFDKFVPDNCSFVRKSLGLSIKANYVLFFNNMSDPNKNYQLLKQATEYIKSKYHILTPFPVKHEEVPLYLNAADVLVHVSKIEGSSNLVKEALACNCPIISTDVGDAKENIENVEGSYIIDFNPIEIADKIDLILKNKTRTNSRSEISHLRSEVVAESIIKFYKIVIAD